MLVRALDCISEVYDLWIDKKINKIEKVIVSNCKKQLKRTKDKYEQ